MSAAAMARAGDPAVTPRSRLPHSGRRDRTRGGARRAEGAGSDVARAEVTTYDLGAARWRKTGEALPESVLAELREHRCDPTRRGRDPRDTSIPTGLLERELLLRLRFELDQHVNLRPLRLFDGVASPLRTAAPVDILVVREATEGAYLSNGGFCVAAPSTKSPPRSASTPHSRGARGARRIPRAAGRPRRHLTLVHKTNVFSYAGSLWSRTVERLTPDTRADRGLRACRRRDNVFRTDPGRFDVIVTDNMFGDILTDLGAALPAGWPGRQCQPRHQPGQSSMFEPVHGSAPDLAGHGLADPTATVLSVALLLIIWASRIRPSGSSSRGVRSGYPRSQAARTHRRDRDRLAALTSSRVPPPASRARSETLALLRGAQERLAALFVLGSTKLVQPSSSALPASPGSPLATAEGFGRALSRTS